jgi:hypothetical protein
VERPSPLAAFFETAGQSRHSNEKELDMKGVKAKKELSSEQREELLRALQARFENNMNRHEALEWAKVKAKLEANPEKL